MAGYKAGCILVILQARWLTSHLKKVKNSYIVSIKSTFHREHFENKVRIFREKLFQILIIVYGEYNNCSESCLQIPL